MDQNIKNIAFYSFFKPSFNLEHARDVIQHRMGELKIKGSILLAQEGINCSLSGITEGMDTFLQFLLKTIGITNPKLKISYSEEIPFKRSLVKVKPFIVAKPGKTTIDLTEDSAPYISSEELHQWIKNNKIMVVLDTRNDFEYQAGRFKNSLHLGTKHFADFEGDLQKAPSEWQSIPVITFCTGGIRCEKAAPLMLKKGFREVYQLERRLITRLRALHHQRDRGFGGLEREAVRFQRLDVVQHADDLCARRNVEAILFSLAQQVAASRQQHTAHG